MLTKCYTHSTHGAFHISSKEVSEAITCCLMSKKYVIDYSCVDDFNFGWKL